MFSSLIFPWPTDIRETGTAQGSKSQDVNFKGWEGVCGFHSACSPTMPIRHVMAYSLHMETIGRLWHENV